MRLLHTTADRLEQDDLIFKFGSKEAHKVLGCTKLKSGVLSFWLQKPDQSTYTCSYDPDDKLHTMFEDPLELLEVPAGELDNYLGGPEGVFSTDDELFHLVDNVFHENGTTYVLCAVDKRYFKLPSDQKVMVLP